MLFKLGTMVRASKQLRLRCTVIFFWCLLSIGNNLWNVELLLLRSRNMSESNYAGSTGNTGNITGNIAVSRKLRSSSTGSKSSGSWVVQKEHAPGELMARLPDPRRSLLTVIPGFGDEKRLPQLKETLDALRRSAQSDGIGFSCLVYVWKDDLLIITANELDSCTVLGNHGLWTHHMLKAGQWFSATQQDLDSPTITHVAILMDDVDVRSVNVPRFIQTMTRSNLDVATASENNGLLPSGQARAHCTAHETGHVDILFTLFTPTAFQCWLSLIDTSVNPLGWGYDVSVADLCRVRVGVINHEELFHRRAGSSIDNERQYNDVEASDQMWNWMNQTHHLRINTELDIYTYFSYVTNDRPRELGYCHDVQFRLPVEPTASSLVAGLKSATSERALFITDVPSVVNSTNCIDFVDSIRDFKVDQDAKWVGVLDYVVTAVPPAHVVSTSAPLPWMHLPEFVSRAPNCVALFVFTSHTAAMVSNQLKGTRFADHVAVCQVRHAIPPHHHLKATTSVQTTVFIPDTHLERVVNRQAALVLWGFEPYNRVASLHQLRTKRKKIWLARSEDVALADLITNAELQMEGVSKDPLVRVMDTRKLLDTKYEQMLLQNIVLVDVWPEGSYAAALDAIAWRAPFFFRKQAGLVEYLGAGYPLFFTSLAEVQMLLDDPVLLEREMLDAHYYLDQLYQHHISSNNTWDDMARTMVNCTLKAMATWEIPEGVLLL